MVDGATNVTNETTTSPKDGEVFEFLDRLIIVATPVTFEVTLGDSITGIKPCSPHLRG